MVNRLRHSAPLQGPRILPDGPGCTRALIRLGIEILKSASVNPRETSNEINKDRVSSDSRDHDLGGAARSADLSADFIGIMRAWVTVLSMRLCTVAS